MAIIQGRLSIKSKSLVRDIGPIDSTDFNLTLSSAYKYKIGIDQSTTCTGIAIQSVDKDITILIDFLNTDSRDPYMKESFYRDLKYFIKKVIHGQKLKYFVHEMPLNVRNQRYASRMLIELSGRVKEWESEFPELQKTVVDSIFPQSWQSLVVDKSKGTNRMRKKECIAEDLCDMYPEFCSYKDMHVSKDLDSFDALGILIGYERYAYTPEGIPKICGIIEKRHTSLVCYHYVRKEEIEDFNSLNSFMGEAVSIFKPIFKVFNDNKSKFENIKMASSNYPCTVTILPNKLLDELKWKYDFEVKDDYVMLAYILNTARFSTGSLNALKGVLPWNENIQSI